MIRIKNHKYFCNTITYVYNEMTRFKVKDFLQGLPYSLTGTYKLQSVKDFWTP